MALTPDGRLHLMINARVTGDAAEVHRRAVASVAERFDEQLVWAALRDGRTYTHLTLVYDFFLEPSQLPRLEAALEAFASTQQAVRLSFAVPHVWQHRVVSFRLDELCEEYAAARSILSELLSTLSALDVIPAERLVERVEWHATVAMRDQDDAQGFDAESIRQHVLGLGGLPTAFLFDNVTLMVKDGAPGPYRGTATPARTFPFARARGAGIAPRAVVARGDPKRRRIDAPQGDDDAEAEAGSAAESAAQSAAATSQAQAAEAWVLCEEAAPEGGSAVCHSMRRGGARHAVPGVPGRPRGSAQVGRRGVGLRRRCAGRRTFGPVG